MDDKIKVVIGDDDKVIDTRFFDTLDEALEFVSDCIWNVGITRNNDSEYYDEYLCCWISTAEIEAEH